MGRTTLSTKRCSEIKNAHIGRIIVFCEGKTEECYFDYFAKIVNKDKYTDVEIVLESANGNAQTVLSYADEFLLNEHNNRKFNTYGKYLVFDCDSPKDIQSVIAKSKDYELLVSNHLFETWLLMHFEEIGHKLTKKNIYQRLSDYLYHQYKKGNKGHIREIIQNGSIDHAIKNAYALENQYIEQGKSLCSDIIEMNPYTSVHKLIEQFMLEISDGSH